MSLFINLSDTQTRDLRDLALRLQSKLETKDRKYHLKTYKNCFVGKDAVKYIFENEKFAKKDVNTATKLGKLLVAAGFIKHVTGEHDFENEKYFYTFIESALKVKKNDENDISSIIDAMNDMEIKNGKMSQPRLVRSNTIFDFDKSTGNSQYVSQVQPPYTKIIETGLSLLRNSAHNKGLSFTWQERKELNLHGLLPPCFRSLHVQSQQVLHNINRMKSSLDKYMYFMGILDSNEKLFFKTLGENLQLLMPIVYTPTVGLACQKFGYIFTRPRGMYITIKDTGRVYEMLKNWPENDVKAICFTDGERILGLGDLGTFGMGIPIGKLALYTACAGVKPHQLLPVTIDVGTNRKELREDKFYTGLKQERDRTKKYDELISEFFRAATLRWGPTTLIQFEDFGNRNAFRLLQQYKDKYCTFNDDIQGTASVALAGIYNALRVKDAKCNKLKDHIFLMYGAGSAGVGIANLIATAISKECNMLLPDAKKHIWLVDSRGLVFKDRKSGGINAIKSLYAHEWENGEIKDLAKVVEATKATAIIGVSGQGGTFTQSVLKAMLKNNNRPLVFPMSNPTSKAECTAADAFKYTNNKCVFASGSPFPKMKIDGIDIIPAQGNNAYVFPGVALGIIACQSITVNDEMFLIAAQTLANLVTNKQLEQATIYPGIDKIKECSFEIAVKVVEYCYKEGYATQVEPKSLRKLVTSVQYNHNKHHVFRSNAFDSLQNEFGDNAETKEDQ